VKCSIKITKDRKSIEDKQEQIIRAMHRKQEQISQLLIHIQEKNKISRKSYLWECNIWLK
jgi:hypothetical protein